MPVPKPAAQRSRPPMYNVLFGLMALIPVCGWLSACSAPAVSVDAAQEATHPDCAGAMLAMPAEISDQNQRETTSQGTTAYGDPAALVVRCGIEPPQPTTDVCSRVNGVDWIIRPTDDPNRWKAVTYGRVPAFEVTLDTTVVPSSTALVDLSSAVSTVQAQRECLSVTDSLEPTAPTATQLDVPTPK